MLLSRKFCRLSIKIFTWIVVLKISVLNVTKIFFLLVITKKVLVDEDVDIRDVVATLIHFERKQIIIKIHCYYIPFS